MKHETIGVTVRLLDSEYRFSCLSSERDELLEAAHCLDDKMREIREHGSRNLSQEAVAVMAAMNLSHELLRQQRLSAEADTLVGTAIQDILHKVDSFLSKIAPPEL